MFKDYFRIQREQDREAIKYNISRKSIKVRNRNLCLLICMVTITLTGCGSLDKDRFRNNTTINGIDISKKNIDEVESLMEDNLKNYIFNMNINENTWKIKGSDIGIRTDTDLYSLLTTNRKEKKLNLKYGLSYDNVKLNKVIFELGGLNGIDDEYSNPLFQYTEQGLELIKEDLGNRVNKKKLITAIGESIGNNVDHIKLDSNSNPDIVINTDYTTESVEVKEANKTISNYLESNIKYVVGKDTEIVEESTIFEFLNIDEEYNVDIDTDRVKEYIKGLSSKYDRGLPIKGFKTTKGNMVDIKSGSYGWYIAIDKEAEELIDNILSKTEISREPIYANGITNRADNLIGDTYIEIDISNQRMWLYKDGVLKVSTDIVTGTKNKTDTPKGIYRINYKQRNATLKGTGYRTGVSYWIPFNKNIGIHDATWRNSFGGSIYNRKGSHGCINTPKDKVSEIYNNVDSGTPVIVY